MKQILILLLTSFVLTTCNQEKKPNQNQTIDTITTTTNNKLPTNRLTPIVTPDCSIFKFINVKQQADSLMNYVDKKHMASDEKFICAFPNSFKGMQNIFGFDDNNGAAPLYENGEKFIRYFANLNTISKEIYYDKYISICVDGVWEGDNIREAFGFADKIINDTETTCSSLSKRTDKEIKSVFHFIIDGPHPNNKENKETYNRLFSIITKQNQRLGKLLNESYNKVMLEDDGH